MANTRAQTDFWSLCHMTDLMAYGVSLAYPQGLSSPASMLLLTCSSPWPTGQLAMLTILLWIEHEAAVIFSNILNIHDLLQPTPLCINHAHWQQIPSTTLNFPQLASDGICAQYPDLLQDARDSMRNLMWHQSQKALSDFSLPS